MCTLTYDDVITAGVPIGAIIGGIFGIFGVIIVGIVGTYICIRRSLTGVRWTPVLSRGLLRYVEGKFLQFRQYVTTGS